MQGQPPLTPMVIRIIEEPSTGNSVTDLLFGIVELTTVLAVSAVLLGLLTGAVLVAIAKRKERMPPKTHASEDLYAALHGPTES